MENRKTAPIGVFDSGVGGLTVAREISRQLPNENIVYFGDTARVPYGSKSQNTIIRFFRADHPLPQDKTGEGDCDSLQYRQCAGSGCGEG